MQLQFRGSGMKLKDKKIELLESKLTIDDAGNHIKSLVPVAMIWAYFRKLSGDEIFAAATTSYEGRSPIHHQLPHRSDTRPCNTI